MNLSNKDVTVISLIFCWLAFQDLADKNERNNICNRYNNSLALDTRRWRKIISDTKKEVSFERQRIYRLRGRRRSG